VAASRRLTGSVVAANVAAADWMNVLLFMVTLISGPAAAPGGAKYSAAMNSPAALPFSEACERNKGPILEILRSAFAGTERVLEIGSGSGQHAVWFAQHLPHLTWQPSDVPAALAGLRARLEAEAPDNVLAPLALDVALHPWPVAGVDGIFAANTLHIVSWPRVEHFFRGVGEVLVPAGTLCVYGPFRYGDAFTTPSNAEFDLWLKRRDPASGVRDFEAVDELARAAGLTLLADHAMPANNQCLLWRKAARG
jgi:SAM-dependent methyltransferase